jgi:putative heme-binding domain-containing protein
MRLSRRLALAAALLAGAIVTRDVAAQALQDHQYSSADIESGSRLYSARCMLCHGPDGDRISGINLRRGTFRQPMSDADLRRVITEGFSGKGMPPFALQPPELEALVAFIRAGFDVAGPAVKVGDAARGQKLFEGKGACGSCHRVFGKGPRDAPDLSDIGAIRSPAALSRSLTDPTAAMIPINRPVRVVTRDGRTIRGRRLNEDTYTVQILDAEEGRLLSLVKADLREYELSRTSPMAPLARSFTVAEVSDLIAYLLTLRGLR